MYFPLRQSFSSFGEVAVPSEPPFFVFDEIGQLNFGLSFKNPALVRYSWEQIGSYDDDG